jgi:hypothetical protein
MKITQAIGIFFYIVKHVDIFLLLHLKSNQAFKNDDP